MKLENQRIVCLSSLPWAGLQTSRHHLSRHLAVDNDVLFIDPPRNLLRHGIRQDRGVEQVADRIWLASSPPHLPYGPPLLFWTLTPLNQRLYAAGVRRSVDRLGWVAPVLWNASLVYPAPLVSPTIEPSVHVFHMTDSLWDYSEYRPRHDHYLQRIIDDSDLVVACTPELVDRLSGRGVPVRHLPHGVDPERFESARKLEPAVPEALQDRARPRLGFVGNLEQRLDIDVLESLARAPGSVTLVGPNHLAAEDAARLRRAGCHLDGPVPYEDVPAWLTGFDIGLVPYRMTPLVDRSRPLKLLEYLAAGLPVVATDIPAAREFAPEVRTASTPDAFCSAVAEAWAGEQITPRAGEARQRRARRVEQLTWRRLADRFGGWIAELLPPDRSVCDGER